MDDNCALATDSKTVNVQRRIFPRSKDPSINSFHIQFRITFDTADACDIALCVSRRNVALSVRMHKIFNSDRNYTPKKKTDGHTPGADQPPAGQNRK